MSASTALRELLVKSTAATLEVKSATATAASILERMPIPTAPYALLLLLALALLSLSLHTTASGARAVKKAMKKSDDAHDALEKELSGSLLDVDIAAAKAACKAAEAAGVEEQVMKNRRLLIWTAGNAQIATAADGLPRDVELAVFVSLLHVQLADETLSARVQHGALTVWASNGVGDFTGSVSARMLRECGATCVRLRDRRHNACASR